MKRVTTTRVQYDSDDGGNPVEGPQKLIFEVPDDFSTCGDLAELISEETGLCVVQAWYVESRPGKLFAGSY